MTATTPSQTIGPFFHDGLAHTGGHVLAGQGAAGERIRLVGRVLDGNGEGVDDGLVEIWQPDGRGVFHAPPPWTPRTAAARVAGFRSFGRADTAEGGRFAFETVKPGPPSEGGVPGSGVPYISVRVFARGLLRAVVTRVYFPGEENDRDPVYAAVDPSRRQTLVARFEREGAAVIWLFDVTLQGPGETVFFDI